MRQQLECIANSYIPRTKGREQIYVVGNLEMLSASIFYTGDSPKFTRNGEGFIVPLNISGTSIHDTYKIDGSGNISGGHTTVNLPKGGKVYMPHGYGRPSIRRGS